MDKQWDVLNEGNELKKNKISEPIVGTKSAVFKRGWNII